MHCMYYGISAPVFYFFHFLLLSDLNNPASISMKDFQKVQMIKGSILIPRQQTNNNQKQVIKSMEGPSRNQKEQSVDIQKLSQDIKTVKSRLELHKNHKECTFVLGATGGGKSTLISYLGGAKFTVGKKGLGYVISHNNSKFPEIGNTKTSCTDVPSYYPFINNTVFYDPPGFVDSRGLHQQILNSYSNAKMFKVGTSARIILVVELSTLRSSRGAAFVGITDRLYDLFESDFDKVTNCCLLVISKVNPKQFTLGDIVEQIDGIANENKNLREKPYQLLKTLIRNKKIVTFPNPDNFQDPSLKLSLEQSILKTNNFHVAHEPKIPLEAGCKNTLENLNQLIQRQMASVAEKMGTGLYQKFVKDKTNKEAMKKNLLELKLSKSIVSDQFGVGDPKKLQQLQQKLRIDGDLMKQLYQCLSQVQFCLTLHPKMKTSSKTEEILLKYIEKAQTELDMALNKILNKEDQIQMHQQHIQVIQDQQKQFKKDLQEQERHYQRKIELAREESRKADNSNNEMMMKMMGMFQQMNANHAAQMRQLNKQLIASLNKPQPQIVYRQKKRGGFFGKVLSLF